ncbi:MAG: DUF5518 domain-containing protein [Salinarchaeum sp.]
MNDNRLTHAVMGAAVTLLGSVILFSPLVGGGLTGWLAGRNPADGARAGALSGAIASTVLLPLLVFGVVFAVFDAGILTWLTTAVVVAGASYLVGLSVLGGYLGVALRKRYRNRVADVDTKPDVETLKEQYAAGDLDDLEFERQLETRLRREREREEEREHAR